MLNIERFENEDALDLLANILEPAANVINDPEFEKRWKSGMPVIYAVQYALKEHKGDVIAVVSAMHGESPETYRFNAIDLMKDVMEIVSSPVLNEVFSSQSQKKTVESSGSATESTGEDEQ